MKLTILFLFTFTLNNLTVFSQKKKDSISFNCIYKIITNYSRDKKNTEALFYSKKLFQKSFENKNIRQQAKSYYKIAEFQSKRNLKDSTFYYYKKSKQLYFLLKDSVQIGRNLSNLAIIESNFGSYSNSDSIAVQALKYLNGRRVNTIASIYNCLAINSKKQELYNQAIYNYKKALSYKLSNKYKITIKNNIANVYKELKNYSKSISILENLLKDSISNRKTKARIMDNLAHIKWMENPIWYGKASSGKMEFFTHRGIHPETLKELKPITEYIINRYVLTNKEDKTIIERKNK
ncbi:MAG: hypothetical protein ACWIPJ_06465 [Polaribacter sp.]